MLPRLLRPRQSATDVACPRCRTGRLEVRFSCLTTRFCCGGCGEGFGLEQLAPLLDESAFNSLAELVGDRFSDRV